MSAGGRAETAGQERHCASVSTVVGRHTATYSAVRAAAAASDRGAHLVVVQAEIQGRRQIFRQLVQLPAGKRSGCQGRGLNEAAQDAEKDGVWQLQNQATQKGFC
jgi:hypothetical protein